MNVTIYSHNDVYEAVLENGTILKSEDHDDLNELQTFSNWVVEHVEDELMEEVTNLKTVELKNLKRLSNAKLNAEKENFVPGKTSMVKAAMIEEILESRSKLKSGPGNTGKPSKKETPKKEKKVREKKPLATETEVANAIAKKEHFIGQFVDFTNRSGDQLTAFVKTIITDKRVMKSYYRLYVGSPKGEMVHLSIDNPTVEINKKATQAYLKQIEKEAAEKEAEIQAEKEAKEKAKAEKKAAREKAQKEKKEAAEKAKKEKADAREKARQEKIKADGKKAAGKTSKKAKNVEVDAEEV